MRDLNDADAGIGEEADRAHEEIALRNEICVENRDEIGACLGQSVIDIAALAWALFDLVR